MVCNVSNPEFTLFDRHGMVNLVFASRHDRVSQHGFAIGIGVWMLGFTYLKSKRS
jgi:hypothetical protein